MSFASSPFAGSFADDPFCHERAAADPSDTCCVLVVCSSSFEDKEEEALAPRPPPPTQSRPQVSFAALPK